MTRQAQRGATTTQLLLGGLVVLGLGVGAAALIAGKQEVRGTLVGLHPGYEPPEQAAQLAAVFDGEDAARARIGVQLELVLEGVQQVTDIAFVPDDERLMAVALKTGELLWADLEDGGRGQVFKLDVLTASEQGLLGVAFHPKFRENGRFYINHVVREGEADLTRVVEMIVIDTHDLRSNPVRQGRVVLDVVQPYPNHNGGELAFGPDGMLYIGLGDGGWRNDPHGNGQDPSTLLGSMLRVDVDGATGAAGYAVPPDNPFVGVQGHRPEIWALGLRNPWRYSFGPDGRLWVADVGQNRFEEIDVVARGQNMGWNTREAAHCFPPEAQCAAEGLTDPVYEYGRTEGQSVTGGYVYTGAALPELAGRYVFGDFVTGRLWALDSQAPAAGVKALGRWPILLSTFGQDAAGELYLADYGGGRIFRLVPAKPGEGG